MAPASIGASSDDSVIRLDPFGVTGESSDYFTPDATSATKTDTPILQTPISVQVVPQQVLRDQKVLRLDDALQNVSGVVRNNDSFGTADSYSIRGFDQLEVTYEDGLKVDQYTTSGFARDMANVDRIEVIKGPASVLYGRSEPGGLVNVVTKKPLETPAFAFEQELGSYGLYRTSIDATGPLNDSKTWLYRLNAAYEDAGSYTDFIHTDRLVLFPTLQWRPNERNQVTVELKLASGTDEVDQGIPFLADGTPANVPLSRNYSEPDANRSKTKEYSVKVSASHDFTRDLKLRLIYKSEYHDEPTLDGQYYSGTVDQDGNLARFVEDSPVFHHLTHQVALDLTGIFETAGIKHTVVVGADYYHQQGRYTVAQPSALPPSINIYDPIYGQAFPPLDPTFAGFEQSGQNAWGVYAQDQLELHGGFFVLSGLRFDRATTFEHGTFFTADSRDTPPITPRLGLLWQPRPELSAYGTYTSNFGATPLGSQTWDHRFLPSESAQQFELGLKSELFHKRLTASASVYQLTKQNIATADPDPNHPNSSIAIGEARSRGVEFDVAGQITPGWSVIGNYSYIDIITTRDNNGLQGLRFPDVPFNNLSLWTTYEIQGRQMRGLRLGAGLVYRDRVSEYSNNQIPGSTVINAMAGYAWRVGKRVVSAQLNAGNLLNRKYFASMSYISAYPGEPLNFDLSFRLEF